MNIMTNEMCKILNTARGIYSYLIELSIFALVKFRLHLFVLEIATNDRIWAEFKPIIPNRNVGDIHDWDEFKHSLLVQREENSGDTDRLNAFMSN
jgi:hypothetical protein